MDRELRQETREVRERLVMNAIGIARLKALVPLFLAGRRSELSFCYLASRIKVHEGMSCPGAGG
jgi:hypothetical protein